MKWYFVKYRPDETTRDPIVGEFFSTDAIENPAQALVREGIQNTLDAGMGKPVHVRLYCGRLKNSSKIDFWLGGAWEHYSVPKNGLGNLPERFSEMPFLTFEDFGTYGLQGDIEQSFDLSEEKNSFYYFFRAEGRSGKGEQDRGRSHFGNSWSASRTWKSCHAEANSRWDNGRGHCWRHGPWGALYLLLP
jgi:hypothetical protein